MKEIFTQLLQSGCIFKSSDHTSVWIGYGQPTRHAEHQEGDLRSSQTLWVYAPDFFLECERPWWEFPYYCRIESKVLQQSLLQVAADASLDAWNWQVAEHSIFEEMFSSLKKEFFCENLKKAVPVVFQTAKVDSLSLAQRALVLAKLLEVTESSPVHVYGLWGRTRDDDKDQGIWGATPELLFQMQKANWIQTAAVAGTRPHSETARLPLLEDPKEIQEHRFVIDGILNSLQFGLGEKLKQVQVGKTRELVLPQLSHLYTQILFQAECEFEEIVRQLHPTPALGSFPKHSGLEWLRKQQKHQDRWRFGAPFGLIFGNELSICVVAIRNIQWKGTQYLLGAGCGVVQESQLEREWNEIQAKMNTVKRMFPW